MGMSAMEQPRRVRGCSLEHVHDDTLNCLACYYEEPDQFSPGPEFREQARRFMDENDELLRRLADE